MVKVKWDIYVLSSIIIDSWIDPTLAPSPGFYVFARHESSGYKPGATYFFGIYVVNLA